MVCDFTVMSPAGSERTCHCLCVQRHPGAAQNGTRCAQSPSRNLPQHTTGQGGPRLCLGSEPGFHGRPQPQHVRRPHRLRFGAWCSERHRLQGGPCLPGLSPLFSGHLSSRWAHAEHQQGQPRAGLAGPCTHHLWGTEGLEGTCQGLGVAKRRPGLEPPLPDTRSALSQAGLTGPQAALWEGGSTGGH